MTERVPIIDGFVDLVRIGQGGFAKVYRAGQPSAGREVALKVLDAQLDDEALRRFERECVTLGSLSSHPAICTMHSFGHTADGTPYLVLELCRGSLLDHLRDHGPLAPAEAVRMLESIARALEHAHARGVLHRDVKPGNILITEFGEPVLGDFGIARLQEGWRTTSGVVTASLGHAAPEVLDGHPATEASDVWSLASTGYELLSGSAPFRRSTDEAQSTMLARLFRDPPPDLRPYGVPDGLCTALERAMAKDPRQRTPSMTAFLRSLDEAGAADATIPRPTPGTAAVPPPPPPPVDDTLASEPTPSTFVGAPTAPPSPPAAGRPHRAKRGLVVAALVVVLGAVAAAAIGGGGGDDAAAGDTTTSLLGGAIGAVSDSSTSSSAIDGSVTISTTPTGQGTKTEVAGAGTTGGSGGSGGSGGAATIPSGTGGTTGGDGGTGSGTVPTTPTTARSTATTARSTSVTATTATPTAPTTYTETGGPGPGHSWSNYANAGDAAGPTMSANQTVQVSCRVQGFQVQDGNTWWYRIASAPWSNAFYVSADHFYNNGATSGSLNGTPFVDERVPLC